MEAAGEEKPRLTGSGRVARRNQNLEQCPRAKMSPIGFGIGPDVATIDTDPGVVPDFPGIGSQRVAPLLARVGDWATFIEGGLDEAMAGRLELHLQTGRPLGNDVWMEALEVGLGRRVRSRSPGRPRKDRPKGRK